MPHVEATARIATDARTLWREIGSFQGVDEWHPMLERVEGQGERPGAIRTAYSAGGQQVEQLREVDADQHCHRYSMESGPLPVGGYTAEFRVDDDIDGTSTVSWIADFDVTSGDETEVVAMVRGFLEAGVAELANRYGRTPGA